MILSINNNNAELQEGYIYSIIQNNPNIEKLVLESNPSCFDKKYPTYYEVWNKNRWNTKLSKLLRDFNFSKEEASHLIELYKIEANLRVPYTSAKLRAFIFIHILLLNYSLIVFTVPGLSYSSTQECYQLLYNKISNTNKTGVILDFVDKDIFMVKRVNQKLIDDYQKWTMPFRTPPEINIIN